MSQPGQQVTLGAAVSRYLAGFDVDQRLVSQHELSVFTRWFGSARLLRDLKPYEVERYAEWLGSSANLTARLTPVKSFLTFARKEGLVEDNLATHLKVRTSGKRGRERTAKTSREAVRLTPDGHAGLKAELEALHAQRPQIAEELRHAMADKDFRENAPLDAARHRQGLLEARIRELEAILKWAEVVQEEDVSTARAGIGSTVELWDLLEQHRTRYTLVHANEANIAQGKVSVASPLGRALLDRTAGEIVEVKAPAGTMRYRLEVIERSG